MDSRLLTPRETYEALDRLEDDEREAEYPGQFTGSAIHCISVETVKAAQDAKTDKLSRADERHIFAGWWLGRCPDHETPSHPGRWITPRYNCELCIQMTTTWALSRCEGKAPWTEER